MKNVFSPLSHSYVLLDNQMPAENKKEERNHGKRERMRNKQKYEEKKIKGNYITVSVSQ